MRFALPRSALVRVAIVVAAAAGSGEWMSNARIATYTAKNWHSQPRHWKNAAAAAGTGAWSTPSP